MKNILTFIVSSLLIITSCNDKKETKSTVIKIDNAILTIVDSNQVYDISQSPNFSRENEQYSVVQYAQNDSIKLAVETYNTQNKEYTRQLYYQNNKLIYASEIGYNFTDTSETEYIHNTYFLGDGSQINYVNLSGTETETDNYKLTEQQMTVELDKASNAIKQLGDFEMKFGEFLVAGPQSYLILSNVESKYDIALYIQKGDFLLDELYTNPEKYKGKTIFANHEFITENGVSKMAYRGGMLIQR